MFVFLLSYLVCSQMQPTYFLDDRHLEYITKSFKKNVEFFRIGEGLGSRTFT
jgi:hypothetical protein